jgi:hypothetical protein
MQVETKYLRLCQPAALGEQIDGWRVCWLGGWVGQEPAVLLRDGGEGEELTPTCFDGVVNHSHARQALGRRSGAD